MNHPSGRHSYSCLEDAVKNAPLSYSRALENTGVEEEPSEGSREETCRSLIILPSRSSAAGLPP